MRASRNRFRLLLVAGMLAALCGAPSAGERCDIVFENAVDDTVLVVRVKYSTPYGEPRFSQSRIDTPKGGQYRIGVQGAILPETIIAVFVDRAFSFTDLSGLDPDSFMHVVIDHEDGVPVLRRSDGGGGEAWGVETAYLTAANRPNAVDKDRLIDAESLEEVVDMVRERIGEERARQGEPVSFGLEVGPIWNHEHALEICPEAARRWSEENGVEARWTGNWATTVPGKMSECGCVAGAADEDETIVGEDGGWGKSIYFPVRWMEWYGVGMAGEWDSDLSVGVRMAVPDDGGPDMLDELLEDLRIDGYRPVHFEFRAYDPDAGKEMEGEIDFRKEEDDKWDAHDRVMEKLTEAYDMPLVKCRLAWVEDGAFERFRESGEVPETRGVVCAFSRGAFEAVFMPSAAFLLE